MDLYPLKFNPIYKEKIWGGDKLTKVFNRYLPNNKIGESWEVAAHPNGTSIIENGIYQGRTITELIDNNTQELLGKAKLNEDNRFPLLVKILDANAKLSVQVHPDDEYADKVENELGKTEMWYIIDAEPDAKLVYGLKPGTRKEDFSEAIEEGELEKYLNEISVEKGDIFYMPSGTIHAIEEGILLAEIQQNSDTTYRVYDWNRVGQNGKPRDLHVEKALDVINFGKDNIQAKSTPLTIDNTNYRRSFLAACPYFVTEKVDVKNIYELHPGGEKFFIVMNLSGQAGISSNERVYNLSPGDTYFIPADLRSVKIDGLTEMLVSYIPDSKRELEKELNKLNFTKSEINNLAGFNEWKE
ncbi:MAG: type I phosphomannose isomerase catalytic subunit [Halanaerobiales bacterium]